MNDDEHDDLWCLLGKAKAPKVSPFFSRNVLRAVREQEKERAGVLAWLRGRWRLATLAACASLLVSVGVWHQQSPQNDQMMRLAHQVSVSPDYQVIGHLDELLDTEENAVWLDTVY